MKKLFLIPSAALSVLGTVSAFAQDAAVATEGAAVKAVEAAKAAVETK